MKRKKKAKASTVNTGDYDYQKTAIRGANGKMRYSASNGDAVAKALLVHLAGGGTITQVVRANKLKVKDGGNAGLYRMSVGVALRGLVRNDTPVAIGKLTVKTLKQPVALPKVEAAKKPMKARKAKKAKRGKSYARRAVEASAPAPL